MEINLRQFNANISTISELLPLSEEPLHTAAKALQKAFLNKT